MRQTGGEGKRRARRAPRLCRGGGRPQAAHQGPGGYFKLDMEMEFAYQAADLRY